MNIHAERPLASPQSAHTPLGRFVAWVNAKWQARRDRRMAEETLVCLSTLEPRLLNDIGVTIGRLGELHPTLATRNPHVIAAKAVNPSKPSVRRKKKS